MHLDRSLLVALCALAILTVCAPPPSSERDAMDQPREARLLEEWHRSRRGEDRPTRVADTKFSHDRGVYEQPFTLYVSTSTPGATIVYTSDGSEPSASHGNLGSAIRVSDTTVVRAMAYKEGLRETNVDTHTYIFPHRVAHQASTNAVWARRFDLDIEIDPDVVSSDASAFVDGLLSLPTLSLAMRAENLFGSDGIYPGVDNKRREYRASVELIYPHRPDGTDDERFAGFKGFESSCGVRLHGHADLLQKRSLRLVFKNEHGHGKLKYPVFESAVHHAETATRAFDTLVLRAGGQANWTYETTSVSGAAVYTRDQHARDVQLSLSGAAARGIFDHLYLNGVYWGVCNLVERPDRHFLSSYFGGLPDDWLAVNHSGPVGVPPSSQRRKWENIYRYAREHDLTDPASYEHMTRLVDTAQFSDYVLLNWYSGMEDWGDNNWYGALRTDVDSRALFFAWDSEQTYGLTAGNDPENAHRQGTAADVLRHGEAPVPRLFRALVASDDFRLEFADRVYRATHGNGPLEESTNRESFRKLCDYLEPAVFCESARWGDATHERRSRPMTTKDDWIPARDRVLNGAMVGQTGSFVAALRREGYYPSIDPPTLVLVKGKSVSIQLPAKAESMCITVDGSDPTDKGTQCSSAKSASFPWSSKLKARAQRDGEWSALTTLELFGDDEAAPRPR